MFLSNYRGIFHFTKTCKALSTNQTPVLPVLNSPRDRGPGQGATLVLQHLWGFYLDQEKLTCTAQNNFSKSLREMEGGGRCLRCMVFALWPRHVACGGRAVRGLRLASRGHSWGPAPQHLPSSLASRCPSTSLDSLLPPRWLLPPPCPRRVPPPAMQGCALQGHTRKNTRLPQRGKE